jgi:hypothetical protein
MHGGFQVEPSLVARDRGSPAVDYADLYLGVVVAVHVRNVPCWYVDPVAGSLAQRCDSAMDHRGKVLVLGTD